MKLGAWLVQKKKITEEQLARALQDQAFFGERLGNSLIKLGFIDDDTLGEYLAEISRTRFAPARRLEGVPPEVIAAVPARLAAKYRIVPIAIEARKLHLAMRDPKDLLAIDEIAFLTGLPIEPYVATEFQILRAIERYYQIKVGTKTIPVAGVLQEKAPPPPTQQPRGAAAALPRKSGPEIGLDGLPLDADPGDLDQPFMTSAPSPPTPCEPEGPLPISLEEWRLKVEAAPRPPTPAAAPPSEPPAVPRGVSTVAAPQPVSAPGPATMETASRRLREAETRDEVFDPILDFTAARFRRAALFVVQQDRVIGWSGRGDGLFPSRIRNVIVPLDRPSLFVFFRSGGDYFYGPVPDLPANAKFYLDLGCPPPARVLLIPLAIMERTAVILYADDGPDTSRVPEIQQYRRLLQKASLALEVLILRNKIMMI